MTYVITAALALIVGLLLDRARARAKLYYWFPHVENFQLEDDPPLNFQTSAMTIQNQGRKSAADVQVILSMEPDSLRVYPVIPHSEEVTEDGHFVLTIPHLGPKELVTLQIVALEDFPSLLNVRSDAGVAQGVPIQVQRVYATWVNVGAVLLMLFGLGLVIYWVVEAIKWVLTAAGG